MAFEFNTETPQITASGDATSRALLADSQKNAIPLKIIEPAPGEANTLKLNQVAWMDERPLQKQVEPSDTQKKEASSLAEMIKSHGAEPLSDGQREDIHSEFHKQLEQTKDKPINERAASLRAFVGEVNKTLREGNGKLSFRENAAPNGDSISFSLVDKGDGNLVAGLPQRTTYDTMEYSLKRGDVIAQNIPSRDDVPEEMRTAYDWIMQQSRDHVIKTKYGPALEKVADEFKLKDATSQEALNQALGLKPDASSREYYQKLERLMMNKLGLKDQDYSATFSRDLNQAFLAKLELKPGIATQKDIFNALKKAQASVPKDFKRQVPPTP